MTKFMRFAFLFALLLLVVSGIIVLRGVAEPVPSLAKRSSAR